MSLTDDGTENIWHFVSNFQDPESNDVKRWDFSVNYDLLKFEADLTIDSRPCADPRYANMIRNETLALASTLLVTSDGQVLAQHRPGIVKSGGRKTAQGNSKMRFTLAATADLSFNPEVKEVHAMTMGDDCVEDGPPGLDDARSALYQSWGFTLTDSKRGYPFDFCSHLFVSPRVAVPTTWPRMLYRLLSKGFDPLEYDGFLTEIRHLNRPHSTVSKDDVVRFLQWVGWSVQPETTPSKY